MLIQSKPLYIREMYVEIDKKCFTKPIGYIINNNCWLLIAEKLRLNQHKNMKTLSNYIIAHFELQFRARN